ncbi:MAG: sugar ABC transporter permease, partial [Mesorhizobium sp.]
MAEQTSTANAWPANSTPADLIPPGRKRLGWALMIAATLVLLAAIVMQILYKTEVDTIGSYTWRPVVYAYVLWGIALGAWQVLTRGEDGQRALFLLPALLFTIAMVIFPTLFGFYIALTDWNLSSFTGRRFNGLDNFWQMLADPYYRNALFNMVLYVLAVLVEYTIAFGLALLLNAQIKARKFFRVVFLLPLMLSPVAVSWMVGKSLMEYRFGPAATLARHLGWDNPAFFSDPIIARISIMVLDAWTFIPFMMIMLLAGLQAMSREVLEAA